MWMPPSPTTTSCPALREWRQFALTRDACVVTRPSTIFRKAVSDVPGYRLWFPSSKSPSLSAALSSEAVGSILRRSVHSGTARNSTVRLPYR